MFEFSERFQMFDESGNVLRCRVTIKLKRYDPANLQNTDLNRQSPDRTKTRAIRMGDRLDLIAAQEYGDPAHWNVLAAANGIDRPRQLQPGMVIEVPPL
jgi:nucleoid-associated protein YgaU